MEPMWGLSISTPKKRGNGKPRSRAAQHKANPTQTIVKYNRRMRRTLPVPNPQPGLLRRVLSSCRPAPLTGAAVLGPGVSAP